MPRHDGAEDREGGAGDLCTGERIAKVIHCRTQAERRLFL